MSGGPLSRTDIARLLERTSRTFALAIPLLEEPLQTEVGLAYLLFRLADTLEDATRWGRDRRAEALVSFARWVEAPDETGWLDLVKEEAPIEDEGCRELLARAAGVLAATRATGDASSEAILRHTQRTALGMAAFVRRQDPDGGLVLASVEDLREYAYVVAGIVGELLTELFALGSPEVAAVEGRLSADARAFGEGLQLVNILKDAGADRREGRSYLPAGVPRSEIVVIARDDLRSAARYVETLVKAKAPRGMTAFCELPVRLAEATLDALDAGRPKLDRQEVLRIFVAVTR